MKNRFWKQSILALTLGMALTMGVCAEETETEAAAQETEATVEKQAGELSEDLYDFQIQIGDDVMTFPMSYEEFSAYGWELSDHYITLEDTLSPSRYEAVSFSKGDDTLSVYMINLGVNDLTIQECLVGGVDIENYYWSEDGAEVKLAKGIERGKRLWMISKRHTEKPATPMKVTCIQVLLTEKIIILKLNLPFIKRAVSWKPSRFRIMWSRKDLKQVPPVKRFRRKSQLMRLLLNWEMI